MITNHTESGCRRLVVPSLLAACFFLSGGARASQTYYIDEMTNYTNGNACDIANVNTITSSLQSALASDGWGGHRYTESLAWPQDFWESCSTTYGTEGGDSVT